MAVTYDPQVIRKYAEKLYKKADGIIGWHVIVGFVIATAGGVAVFASASGGANLFTILGVAASLGLFGAFIGYRMGEAKAFAVYLQAQTALCQMQIEENTRRVAVAGAVAPAPVAPVVQAQRVG